MKKFIDGFFMAWGNFIIIPCPNKRWDNGSKNMMLAFLPLVGAVIGMFWTALYWVLGRLGLPLPMAAVAMEFYIFFVCGYIHLDGFMDCSDAIMSRRGPEEKHRILKDPSVGAFAAVAAVFLLLAWWGAVTSSFYNIKYGHLLVLPVVSREVAALCVLSCKPMDSSQYAENYNESSKGGYRLAVLLQAAIVIAAAIFLWGEAFSVIAMSSAAALTGFLSCAFIVKQLGGVSGDVAGCVICLSELAGMISIVMIQL